MGIFRFFGDGLANLVTGAGSTADKRVHGFYHHQQTTPQQIEAAYRSSFLMRKAVDLIPFDMTRAGRDWQCEGGDIAKIEAEEKRLQVWPKLQQALILGRLGGGLIVMGIGSENPALPVNPRALVAGSLHYLHVMNRWQVTTGEVITDPGDDHFGQPAYFQINGDSGRQVRIHPSRVICFKGRMVPGLHSATADDLFWGDSEVTGLLDPVKNADAAMNGFASLIDEAKVDTVSIPGLINLVATTEGEQLVTKRISIANTMKSMHNTRILDGGNGQAGSSEEWDTRQVAWTGMPEMIRTYLALVATAADVPATRFIGKSPDGMNATGAGDEANHQTMIRARQEQSLRPALDRLDAALLPSAGITPSSDTWYRFAPLAEMSEKEAADVFKTKMEAIEKLQATGAIPEVAFTKAVQNTAVEENWLPGLDGALAEIPEAERFGLTPEANEDEGEDPSALTVERQRIAANDATPRTLYVSRKVVNVAEIAAWAAAQGITDLAGDLHVTIAYSTTPVDWIKMGDEGWNGDGKGQITIKPGGPRVVEPLGGMAAVLMFSASELTYRNLSMREAGASWDWPDYQPHISLTKAPVDLAAVEPYRGRIVLGPEIFEEIDADRE